MHFPPFRQHPALPPAIGTSRFCPAGGHHFAGPLALNHAAQTLSQCVRGELDLIKMRRLASLLDPLQFDCHRRCLLQQIFQLFLQSFLLRIHAMDSFAEKTSPLLSNSLQLNTPNAKSPIDLFHQFWAFANADMHPDAYHPA